MKRLLALLFGCLLVALPILVLERSDLVWPAAAPGTPPQIRLEFEPGFHSIPDLALGWRGLPNARTVATKHSGDALVYRVEYALDAFGRRITPQPAGARERFVLFFGGSNVFGEGLDARDTLPASVARRLPGASTYNYAFHGYGPQHLLTLVRGLDLRAQVVEPRGDALYLLPHFHLERLIGTSSNLAWDRGQSPYYYLDADGRVLRDRSFATGRAWTTRLYRAVAGSRILRHLDVGLPPRITTEHVRLLCRVLAETRDSLVQRFGPDGLRSFTTVLYPGDSTVWHEPLSTCLGDAGVDLLDLRNLFAGRPKSALGIPGDGHPTALANRLIARALVSRIDDLRQPASAAARAAVRAEP